MRNLVAILCFMLVVGCDTESHRKQQMLQAELEKLRIKADFKPLEKAEAYNFINRHYLPLLDSIGYSRNIYTHPIKEDDFSRRFKRDSVELSVAYGITPDSDLMPAIIVPPLELDENSNWDSTKLDGTKIITDKFLTDIKDAKADWTQNHKLWKAKLGKGYVFISYPQYNPHTEILLIRHWLADGSKCLVGDYDRTFVFIKIPGGWRLR